jgi:hypothetical protein
MTTNQFTHMLTVPALSVSWKDISDWLVMMIWLDPCSLLWNFLDVDRL